MPLGGRHHHHAPPLAEYDKHPLLRERLAGFRHHYGQPAEVRRAFAKAMGIAE